MHNLKVWSIGIFISLVTTFCIFMIFNRNSNKNVEPIKIYRVPSSKLSPDVLQKSGTGNNSKVVTKDVKDPNTNTKNAHIDAAIDSNIEQHVSGNLSTNQTELNNITPQRFMDKIIPELDKIDEFLEASAKRRAEYKAQQAKKRPIWDKIKLVDKQLAKLFPDGDIKNMPTYILSLTPTERTEFTKKFLPLAQEKADLLSEYNSIK